MNPDLVWPSDFPVALQVSDLVALEEHLNASSQSLHSLYQDAN